MTTIGVLVPFLKSEFNSEHVLLDGCVPCFGIAESSAGIR